jgi:hypothetical protein
MSKKYLFTALFNDGSRIVQTEEDKSALVEGKNCFYDVLERIEDVIFFEIVNSETNDAYAIDLVDLHFFVNGAPCFIHDGPFAKPVTNIRLIWFVRNQKDFNQNMEVIGERRQYFFGWQGNSESGENIQRLMEVW